MAQESDERDSGFFSFRRMISPSLIKILYVAGALVITLGGILYIGTGLDHSQIPVGRGYVPLIGYGGAQTALILLAGLAIIVGGNLFWRILCESWIVLFSIHETLISMDENSRQDAARALSDIHATLRTIEQHLRKDRPNG
jgi:hypothetical protein